MTAEAIRLLNEKLAGSEQRESFLGFHMIQYYTENPYGWYLRYVRGLQPLYKKPNLLMGSNIHDAIEIMYRTHAAEDYQIYGKLARARKDQYAAEEDFEKDLEDGMAMLKTWSEAWLEADLKQYKILALEQQETLRLSNGFEITVRPDVIMQRKSDGYIVLMDHKTTRYSIDAASRTFDMSDQPTTYLWAAKKLYPKNLVEGVVCDIIYKRQSKVRAERPLIVHRRDGYLAEWEMQAIGQLTEISQKVKALEDGWPPTMLFPRNGKDESFFSHEWPDIYLSPLPEDLTEAPDGYYVDTWTQSRVRQTAELTEAKEIV